MRYTSNICSYLEAIRNLKKKNVQLTRTIHLSFVPGTQLHLTVDEELGGELGMKLLIKNSHFSELNIGVALDEGRCLF